MKPTIVKRAGINRQKEENKPSATRQFRCCQVFPPGNNLLTSFPGQAEEATIGAISSEGMPMAEASTTTSP